MRKLLTSGAVAVGMLLASCTPANRVVENPLIGVANTMTLDFPKIELSDTATVLHVDAYFRPHNWIRIDAGSYLLADGQKYMLQGSEGILPDSLFWMPDSGEASFVLKFGPLPRGTKSFDFIESDCDDCFKLYGVDLTGKKEYPRYPEGLPRELRKAPEDGPVPEPILAVGTTTVNVRLLGYRRGMAKEVAMYVNSLLNGQEEHTAAIDPESGMATLRFEQYGTAMAYVSCGPVFGMCWIAPGETLDMYVDMGAGGRAVVQRRDKEREPTPGRKLYTSGTYADLNAQVDASGGSSIRMNLYSGDFADYRMSADEYTQMVVSKYESLADSIARSPVSGMMKELSLLTLQQEALTAISMGGFFLAHNYRSVNNEWDYRVEPDYEFASLKPEHYTAVAGLFDINNLKLLMGIDLSDYVNAVSRSYTDVEWADLVHATDGIVYDLPKVVGLPSKAENNALTQEDLDLLHSLREPVLRRGLRGDAGACAQGAGVGEGRPYRNDARGCRRQAVRCDCCALQGQGGIRRFLEHVVRPLPGFDQSERAAQERGTEERRPGVDIHRQRDLAAGRLQDRHRQNRGQALPAQRHTVEIPLREIPDRRHSVLRAGRPRRQL